MTDLYPCVERWLIPRLVLTSTLTGVRPAGRVGNEAGALWLGDRDAISRITTVVLPSGDGVEEKREYWRVSPEVLGRITEWAVERNVCLLAIAHTHMPGVPISLSCADRNRMVRVPGMLAVVIGNGGADRDYRSWAWYNYEREEYHRLRINDLSEKIRIQFDSNVDLYNADAHGVYSRSEGRGH